MCRAKTVFDPSFKRTPHFSHIFHSDPRGPALAPPRSRETLRGGLKRFFGVNGTLFAIFILLIHREANQSAIRKRLHSARVKSNRKKLMLRQLLVDSPATSTTHRHAPLVLIARVAMHSCEDFFSSAHATARIFHRGE